MALRMTDVLRMPPVGGSRLEELIQKGSNLWHGAGHLVLPSTELPVCIHRRNPAPRSPGLHLGQIVEPLRFEDQMHNRIGLEPNDEIRNVIVRLTVVKIRDAKAESRVL